uniref:NADH-ubiquinone oxidoreductase chain 5 n=1 Tax=Pseudodendrothrips mori TaxID=1291231 RepID=A0A7M3T290_9NEOP|nr:NADH dehydrogenase subunit 5 [Pseudodendrothrips mori]QFO91084.1 NADH dehydrogenase subunit 5 [Pseudodendrothrips mori]
MIFVLMYPFFLILGFLFFLISYIFYSLNFVFFIEWNFLLSSFKLSFPFMLDFISFMFMGLVLVIASSIFLFSVFYMSGELNSIRFFYLMFLFILSMIFLILCPNFFGMLLGWDGLGLVSFCLVIFYQNFKSNSAGMLTALTNRVGDVFILASIALNFSLGSWNYMNFILSENHFVLIFFVIAAMTKSAQIPFSAWLPAAMAAPTPVSSLVHSSTLVTAGVYILIRFSYYLLNTKIFFFLLLMSLLTMVMSGMSALLEFDLKKIIALSTLSQLGFMMATLSIGLSNLAFFHLVTHACFKALLFMCAGTFIHLFNNNQDIRNFGFLNSSFSLTFCFFNVANLSLSGFPFLSGFFSKDLILELILMSKINMIFFFLFVFGTFLTVCYSFRLVYYLTFKKAFFGPLCLVLKNPNLNLSMLILFFFSIFLGYFFVSLFSLPFNFVVLPKKLKLMILFVCLFSFFFSLSLSNLSFFLQKKMLVLFLHSMWFLTYLKTDFFKKKNMFIGEKYFFVSSGWIELFFGEKILLNFFNFSTFLSKIMKNYFFFFFIFFCLSIFSLFCF